MADALSTYGTIDVAKRQMNKDDIPVLEQMVASGRVKANPGHMFQVRINAEPEHFLDWDKPLSEQSGHVNQYMNMVGKPEDTGEKIWRTLSDMYDSPQEKSSALQRAGIPGIRYLDQGSRNISDQLKSAREAVTYWRGVGDLDKIGKAERSLATIEKMEEKGSRNYVVFDDKLVNIENNYALGGRVGYADGGIVT